MDRLYRLVYPAAPVSFNVFCWTDGIIGVTSAEKVFIVDIECIEQSAPTYINIQGCQGATEAFPDVAGVQHTISSMTISPFIEERPTYTHFAALSTSHAIFNLYKEETVGEWTLYENLVQLMKQKLKTPVSLDLLINCTCWLKVSQSEIFLAAGSKSGSLYIFECFANTRPKLVSVQQKIFSNWFSAMDFYNDNSGNVYLLAASSGGEIIKWKFDVDALSRKNAKQIRPPDDRPIQIIKFSPQSDNIIAYAQGCFLFIHDIVKDTFVSQQGSIKFISGIQWNKVNLISSCLQGEIKHWSGELELLKTISVNFQPNWGCFGVALSGLGCLCASITMTPRGREGVMFSQVASKGVLDVQTTVPLDDFLTNLETDPEFNWSNRENHWEIINILLQFYNEEVLSNFINRTVGDWSKLAFPQITKLNWKQEIKDIKCSRKLNLLRLVQCLCWQLKKREMEVPELDFIEKQIYWIYVFEYLQYYLNAKSESEDKHSVVLLCSWLKMNLGSVPDTAKTECESLLHDICAKLKKSEDELLEVNEECPLCFNPVKFESHNFGSCTEHTFARCALSLTLLSTAGNVYCPGCNRKVKKNIKLSWDNPIVCPICDCRLKPFIPF